MNIFAVLIGIGIAFFIYVTLAAILRKFWMAPPAEPTADDVEPVDLKYRCSVCGSEVTMTMAPLGEMPEAPRHCREDMELTTSN